MYHINTILVKDSDLGQHGNLFGGRLLYVLDESAASFAMQICDTPSVVTVSIDKCEFKLPARKGSLVKIFGEVDKSTSDKSKSLSSIFSPFIFSFFYFDGTTHLS